MRRVIVLGILSILLIVVGFFFESCDAGYTDLTEDETTEVKETATTIAAETYSERTATTPAAVISADLYENFKADGAVYITLDGSSTTATFDGDITQDDVSITATENSAEDETAKGVEIQYKGKLKVKYVLSGNYTGTVFIKNKKADAAVVLNNVNLTSDNGAGPALRFSSELRTFIVVPAGTTNTITDTRVLNQSSTMYDDKKGSVYSKGALIFTGERSAVSGGTLNIINKGYKHAVYSKDYIRIANLDLNVTVSGTKGRDCLRALNAVIIDGGNIALTGKGTVEDDESVGIKVEGEDADEDDLTVEYTDGAGFVIINNGKLTINTVAKGITAHWKSAESVIGNSSYTATANTSLLYDTFLSGTTATTPDPYVEINGGVITITTTGEPYEGRTDDDPSCSPEGIEAKGNLTINAGTITLNTTDDSINAGGNIVINGGAIYACSSKNDAIDSNGSNGITINGGIIVASGVTTPECAFDCDENPFTVNGGLLVGLGTENYTSPANGKQSTVVLSSSKCGSRNTTFAITDEDENPVFVYKLPSNTGSVIILSSPEIKTGTTYGLITGVTVSGGTVFNNLYTELPEISGGTESSIEIETSESNTVYTDSNAGKGGMNDPFSRGGPRK